MPSLWQKTLFYLGLVDEDDVDEQRPPAGPDAATQARPQPEAEPPKYENRLQRRGASQASGQQPVTGTEPAPPRVAGRRVEPPLASRRRMSPDPAHAEAGMVVGSGSVRTVSDGELECEVVTARSYSDAQVLADHIRGNQPVVLDLRKVEPAMVRRLVDFASGLTYALGGSMRKIGQGVILVTPSNVNISRDERRRLAALGYYEAPEGS
jgi:cell division inhibitor SepF